MWLMPSGQGCASAGAQKPETKRKSIIRVRFIGIASGSGSYHFCDCCVKNKRGRIPARVKYWEIIADNLSEAGWSWGCVSGVDSNGQTMFTVDAHRDGKRFVVRADKKLTAFVELESAIASQNPVRAA
jgi:hypothetical protein